MDAAIDRKLEQWARWRVSGKGVHLGYSESSPIYRMMREHAPTDRRLYRRRRHLLSLGSIEVGIVTVERDIDPQRSAETRPSRARPVPRNPECEQIDRAVGALRERYREAVWLRYCSEYSETECARIMGCSRSGYRLYVTIAHDCIDIWLRAQMERREV